MEPGSLYALLHSAWTVMAVVAFAGIVAWTYSPSRKQELEQRGRIPLDDDS
jgi:cbb3-type cytochrome oxidase subunit 3